MIIGGAQENTLLCCRDLVREYGDDVLLITGPSPGPEGSLLEQGGEEQGGEGQGGAGGVPLEVVDSLRRPINPWQDARAYRQLKRTLREFKPDVVHTHSAKGGILGRAAAWSLGVPAIVHTIHGAPFHPYQSIVSRGPFRVCERWAARRCHAIVSVADAMTRLMVQARVAPADKFTTIHSGMEVEPFLQCHKFREETRRELGYTAEDVVIGKVARLFHLKGHKYVIEAARQIAAAVPQARFLFVGDGLLGEELRRQVAQAGLEDRFKFHGLVPPRRIPALISAMDIVVHASLREGLARVLPQALIAGKAVVSYDVDGAAEVVLPGVTGFLAPPKSINELAEPLEKLAVDESLRANLGAEGRRRFTDQFRHERMSEQIRQLYERLLDATGQGGDPHPSG
jgi:glycosyltransferase involved in cell wall biosynthesis